MPEENAEIIRRLYRAFNEGDAEAVCEGFTDDAEFRPAFIGGGIVEGAVYRGRDGIAEFVEVQKETWRSLSADPVTIRDLGGNRGLVEVRLEAVGRASGVAVNRTTWNVFELRDGKVAAGRVYPTKAEALEAAGLKE
jgi:ketosteroid isomerase-like protein